ncbi:MAG TPA: porin family protein [Paracoccus sp. (in: a-proteobacteria)]|uniref:outer membrane protein n=1 Tax=Paracoccus sp. TaxID=267 RepID=UPI002D0C57A8|nr:porin family protein [Paracoccus sp. (in: a-proteobacteria)]HWL56657.1 porin family protein [Paracoccus sp. (in: a-proteobacteria)]
MKLACYAILAGFAATAAQAGGYAAPVVEQPVVAPVVAPVETADWTGFYAGIQYGKGNAELDYAGASADSDFDGYGLHAGYMRDFGNFVLGGELDYNRVSLDDTDEDGDLWRLRGRAGYDMGKFLPYATLGVAQLELGDLSETGITYGLGADYMINDKFTVGAEYTRNDFNDIDDVDGADLDTDLFQVRASYRF